MRDPFVTYGFPFIDLDFGGSIDGIIDAIEKVIEQMPPDVKVISGHGTFQPRFMRRKLQRIEVANLDFIRFFSSYTPRRPQRHRNANVLGDAPAHGKYAAKNQC